MKSQFEASLNKNDPTIFISGELSLTSDPLIVQLKINSEELSYNKLL